jgi:ParB-like chromosome segregation protein Spo0J
MKAITKHLVEVEIHQLNMPFADRRLQDQKMVKRLADLMARQGQKVALIAATDGKTHSLIDGYLRVAAARRCGLDTVWVDLWECDVDTALTQVLAASGSRDWKPIEEAHLIQGLMRNQQCSTAEIAVNLGREPESIRKCLKHLEGQTDDVFDAVRKGVVSSRDAQRVIIPLMHANTKHGEQLLKTLAAEPLGSRQLDAFLGHYRQSTRESREKMVANPILFIKAYENTKANQAAKKLARGVEGDCEMMLRRVRGLIKQLRRQGQVIFAEGDELARANLRQNFDEADADWQILKEEYERSCDAQFRKTRDDSNPAHAGVLDSQNQLARQGLAQHGAQDPQGDCAGGEGSQRRHTIGPVDDPVQALRRQRHAHSRDPGRGIREEDRLLDDDPNDSRGPPA